MDRSIFLYGQHIPEEKFVVAFKKWTFKCNLCGDKTEGYSGVWASIKDEVLLMFQREINDENL